MCSRLCIILVVWTIKTDCGHTEGIPKKECRSTARTVIYRCGRPHGNHITHDHSSSKQSYDRDVPIPTMLAKTAVSKAWESTHDKQLVWGRATPEPGQSNGRLALCFTPGEAASPASSLVAWPCSILSPPLTQSLLCPRVSLMSTVTMTPWFHRTDSSVAHGLPLHLPPFTTN